MSINSFKEIQIAYTKTFNNASELIEESSILLNHGRYARSYLLAHIGIGELGRCIMLSSAIMKSRIRALDVKKLNRRQTSHVEKIELAYSFVKKMRGYESPLTLKNRLEIITDFFPIRIDSIISDEEIQKLNDFKNASFYVDQYQNITKAPKEIISEQEASGLLRSAMLLKEFFKYN